MVLRCVQIFSWEVVIKGLYFELNYDIKSIRMSELCFFESINPPPPPLFSSNEEIVPSDVPICSKCTYGTLSNI